MSYDPAIVGRYGKLVELWATDRYPLTIDYPLADADGGYALVWYRAD